MAITPGTGFNNQIDYQRSSSVKALWKPTKGRYTDKDQGTQWKLNGSDQLYAVDRDGAVWQWPQRQSELGAFETVSLYRIVRGTAKSYEGQYSGEYTYSWKFVDNLVRGTGNETPEQVAKTARKNQKSKQYGKNGKDGSSGKSQDAQFVSTEGWAIMANAPMLSINYPDQGFLTLQTDPYVSKVVKGQDRRRKNTVQGSGKDDDDKKRKSKSKIASQQDNRPSKRKRKVSKVEGSLPSDKMRLGYLEQDIYLHSDLASNQKIKSAQKAKKDQKSGFSESHRWRFKFHYNPSTVNVSQSYNTELDPLFIAKDPAASIQSGSAVSFELWINRIEEMQILNHDGSLRLGSGNVDDEYVQWAWRGGKVSAETRSLIRTMGTQYDLEYLYRVANGDPLDTWKGLSADYGILFGQPLRLHFTAVKNNGRNVGMNYYGFISSLSIDHKMFSMDMVPSLTVVQVSFTRIPDTLALDSKKLGEAFAK